MKGYSRLDVMIRRLRALLKAGLVGVVFIGAQSPEFFLADSQEKSNTHDLDEARSRAQQEPSAPTIRELRAAVKANPGSASAHVNLGVALRKSGDLEGARSQFLVAAKLQPQNWQVRFRLAQVSILQKNFPSAIVELQQVLRLNPNNREALYNLALAERQAGSKESAIADFRKLITIAPGDAKVHSQLGQLLAERGDKWGAISQFQSALELEPHDVETHYQLARAMMEITHYDEALAEYSNILRINPAYAPAYFGMGMVYDRTDGPQERNRAVDAFRKATQLKPDYGEAYTHLAHMLLERRDLPEAAAVLQTADRLDANDPVLYYVKGLYFRVMGQPEDAVIQFRKSIEMYPRLREPHYELGLILVQKGDLNGAASEFRKSIDLVPDDEPSFINLSQVLRQQGKVQQADALLEKFRSLRENSDADVRANTYGEKGIELSERGDLGGAIANFQAAVQLQPHHAETRRNLAMALFLNGEVKEAGIQYEETIRLNPNDPQAHYGLGHVLAEENRAADSIREFELAVRLNPRYAEAYYMLSQLYELTNEPVKGTEALSKAKAIDPQIVTRMENEK